MRSWHHYGIGLVGLIVGLSMLWQPSPALAAAAPSPGKPTLYDFGRGMCIPCKEMEKVLTAIKSDYGTLMQQAAGGRIFCMGAYTLFQGIRAL